MLKQRKKYFLKDIFAIRKREAKTGQIAEQGAAVEIEKRGHLFTQSVPAVARRGGAQPRERGQTFETRRHAILSTLANHFHTEYSFADRLVHRFYRFVGAGLKQFQTRPYNSDEAPIIEKKPEQRAYWRHFYIWRCARPVSNSQCFFSARPCRRSNRRARSIWR